MRAHTKKDTAVEIAESMLRQINDGAFQPGDKLPSIRAFAKLHGYSTNTVVEAFNYLVAQGCVRPRQGSGYFITEAHRSSAHDDICDHLEQTSGAFALLLNEHQGNTVGQLCVGDGFPPVEWRDENKFDKYYRKIIRTGFNGLFGYGSRFGYMPLRQHLVQKLANIKIDTSPHNILLTQGANQAMDIIIRHFVRPGDVVLVDDPGYYPLFAKLRLQGAKVVGISRRPDGPDIDVLQQQLQSHKVKLFFTQSVGHNPTGSSITSQQARRVLQLAHEHDFLIVEDDPYADFMPTTAPRIASLNQLERTIYIGSFSKSVSAALRVGFIACHADLASDLAEIKMLLALSSSEYCERTLDVILSEGHFLRHMTELRDKLQRSTETALKSFSALGAKVFCSTSHTLFLWATLPGITDSMDLAKELRHRNIAIAPGAVFSIQHNLPSPWARYNVGYVNDDRFIDVLSSLLRAH